jgi:hypothetical protein
MDLFSPAGHCLACPEFARWTRMDNPSADGQGIESEKTLSTSMARGRVAKRTIGHRFHLHSTA